MTWNNKYSDLFGVDSDPVSPPWTLMYGTGLKAVSGSLQTKGPGYNYIYYNGSIDANQKVTVTSGFVLGGNANHGLFLFLRGDGTASVNVQISFIAIGNGNIKIATVVNNVQQGSDFFPGFGISIGDTLSAEIVGDVLVVSINGVIQITRTLTSPPVGGFFGIGANAGAADLAVIDAVVAQEYSVTIIPPGNASKTQYPDLIGKTLHVEARRHNPGDPTVLEYWDFLTGAYVATLVDACKAPMDEAVLDATKSIYSRTTDTWPTEGFYGVYDASGNLVSDLVLIGVAAGGGATAAEVVSAVENLLLGERTWNKGGGTETVKRVDGTTAKVFDLTVDVAGDVVAKVPRP